MSILLSHCEDGGTKRLYRCSITLDVHTVDVNIKPPPRTIAGDYSVKIQASGDQVTSNELDIRVTVESSTIWGWVGVAIILVVSGGLIFMFLRFSRR